MRTHKCKRCGRFVCSSCGESKLPVLQEELGWRYGVPRRVCYRCKEDIANIDSAAKLFQLGWCKDSVLSQAWPHTAALDFE